MALRSSAVFALAAASTCLFGGQTPSVDRILQRFVSALGGRAALDHVSSMVIRGTVELPALNTTGNTVEFFQSPDRFAAITHIFGYGTIRTIYDGHKGWQSDLQGKVAEISGPELADVRRRANIHWNLRLKEFYPGLQVKGLESVDGHNAWKLESTVDNWTYDFYFDSNRGLLLRFDTDRHAPDGASSVTMGDYRRVGRVLFAFGAAESSAPVMWKQTLTTVSFNTAIADEVFREPEAPAGL